MRFKHEQAFYDHKFSGHSKLNNLKKKMEFIKRNKVIWLWLWSRFDLVNSKSEGWHKWCNSFFLTTWELVYLDISELQTVENIFSGVNLILGQWDLVVGSVHFKGFLHRFLLEIFPHFGQSLGLVYSCFFDKIRVFVSFQLKLFLLLHFLNL